MAYDAGSDKSKVADPKEHVEFKYVPAAALVADINKEIQKHGYKLVAALAGRHGGHDVYIKKAVTVYPAVKYWAMISLEIEWIGFNQVLALAIDTVTLRDPGVAEMAHKIRVALTEQANDKRSVIFGVSYNKSSYVNPQTSRSFTGQLAHRQIPSVDWFPALAELDPYVILSLFPKAEATSLMLMLGRAMLGANNTTTLEGVVEHNMRSAAIIVGLDAGLGKSTLLNGIMAAANGLGYTSEPIATAGSRFGWGKIASADIGYKDDLNKATQSALLKSETMKTIITGGVFSSERKGIDSESTKSNAVIICCSNDYNVYDFYGMDSGSISRYNFLYTYNQDELNEKYPDYDARTYENVQRLSNLYSVTPSTIYTYLLAKSVELFMVTLGVEVINGALTRTGDDTTQKLNDELRSAFVYEPSMTHVKDLLDATVRLVALSISTLRGRVSRDACIESAKAKLGFDYELLYSTINQYVCSDPGLAFKLQGVQPACKVALSKRLEDISNKTGNKNALAAFEGMITELVSDKGATYPRSSGVYYQMWSEAKKRLPGLVDTYTKQISNEKEDGSYELDLDNLKSPTRNNISQILEMILRA